MIASQPQSPGIEPRSISRVTVFGGSGFLGRRIVARLAGDGVAVRIAVRHPERASSLTTSSTSGPITTVHADVCDAATAEPAVAGVDYTVGIGGSQLTPQQRQKLALAAAALRQAQVLVCDAPTRDLHRGAATTVLARLLETYEGRTVICALDDASLAALFDRVLTLGQGQLLEDRAPEAAADAATVIRTVGEAAPSPEAEVVELPAAS